MRGLAVTLLGTGTFVPSTRRASPGLVVEAAGLWILLDPGPGALRRLAAMGFDHLDMDLVGVTHRHPDHTLDLVHLLFASRYTPGGRTKAMTLFGPSGFGEFLSALTSAYGEWTEPRGYARTLVELAPGEALERPGLRIGTAEMNHLPVSLGFRFETEDGTVAAYTGDTAYGPGAVELAREADLLVIECSSRDEAPLPDHLTPSGVARIARESGARKLVLVHIHPDPDEEGLARAVRAGCRAEVVLGVDGERFEVTGS